jgi:hypothetical protein
MQTPFCDKAVAKPTVMSQHLTNMTTWEANSPRKIMCEKFVYIPSFMVYVLFYIFEVCWCVRSSILLLLCHPQHHHYHFVVHSRYTFRSFWRATSDVECHYLNLRIKSIDKKTQMDYGMASSVLRYCSKLLFFYPGSNPASLNNGRAPGVNKIQFRGTVVWDVFLPFNTMQKDE